MTCTGAEKRMMGNKMGRFVTASVVSLALGLGLTACSRNYTVAFVYATSSTRTATGVINGYKVDFQSGALQQLTDSPLPTANKNPVALVAAPSGKYIYVVFRDDSVVVSYGVGTDGKLYAQKTANVVGSFPTAATIDAAGKFLYVTSTYQPGFTTALPGPGLVSAFPIDADGNLGTPTSTNVGNSPISIVASGFNNFVYVLDRETITASTGGTQPRGAVLAFSQNASTGALTPVTAGSVPINGSNAYPAGVTPSWIAEDPTARFVYVTDQVSNQLIGYIVGTSGSLVAMTNGPFTTGQFPVNVIIDPRGKYLYVTNFNSSSIGAYAIDTATGTPATSGSGATQVDTNPTCATIEPALGQYLYTSNNAAGTISGLQLDPHNGNLKQIQNQPFPASALPTCVTAVANGDHATQIVNP